MLKKILFELFSRSIKLFLWVLFKILYRVEVRGRENLNKVEGNALFIANHLSWIDGMLSLYLPGQFTFAVDTYTAQKWWAKPFLSLIDFYPIDPTNPMGTKGLINEIKVKGKRVAIFPEGRLTKTGSLMKVYEGPGMIADKSDAVIVPIRLDGIQYTPLSRLRGKVRIRWFPKIIITVLPPVKFEIPANLKGKDRRKYSSDRLYKLMTRMIVDSSDVETTLTKSLIDASVVHGGNTPIIQDITRQNLSYNKILVGATVLGRKLKTIFDEYDRKMPKIEKDPERIDNAVGVFIPNLNAAVVTFFALHRAGMVPAMLNYSTGFKNLKDNITASNCNFVITSRAFIEKAQLEDTVENMKQLVEVLYLEDIKKTVTLANKIDGYLEVLTDKFFYKDKAKADDPAVIMFTSGSESAPKGVVLSHKNLISNRYQSSAIVDYNSSDLVFNAMPILHSFGLSGGLIVPMLSGVKTFLYPSPLHYRIIPELIYGMNATILFGTSTFLEGYGRNANPYDFYSVRYIFSGAEKVKPEVQAMYNDKFGLRILEGYGATECSPLISVNTPMHNKKGTVGKFVPNLDYKLEDVDGIDSGKLLYVKGPNVMLGYLRVTNPGCIERLPDGWYNTGDIVALDTDEFVKIVDRLKRFAKFGGEMISLIGVEYLINPLLGNGNMCAALNPKDDDGNEYIVLLTTKDISRDTIMAAAKEQGLSMMYVPKLIKVVDAIPLFPTGKPDYIKCMEVYKNS